MNYTDIHIHALFGADDGAKTESEMQAMIDAAYKDGTRAMCFTPHFHPGFFGDNRSKADAAFDLAKAYAADKYPDMRLYIGNELRYSKGCVSWIADGACRTLNGTDVVLVDFLWSDSGKSIVEGMEKILNAGYRPLLAHVERYENLKKGMITELVQNGVWMQVNAASVTGANGFRVKLRANMLLKERLVDFISTDAHNTDGRPPVMSAAYKIIEKKCGKGYADAVCFKNALQMITSDAEEGMVANHE